MPTGLCYYTLRLSCENQEPYRGVPIVTGDADRLIES